MKRMIRKRLMIVIVTTMLFSLFVNYNWQIHNARSDLYRSAQDKFWQIGRILTQNEADTEKAREELRGECFAKAGSAAYIIQNNPGVAGDQEELQKIVDLLQIDEVHLFDADGTLYAGSEPRYFGLNMREGEQVSFFLPMLEDHSLKLCQDVTPNTVEGKPMQYAAVWREDGREIVQIGLEPTRVLEAGKKNELSYIFSMVTAETGSVILAVDPQSHRILGSTAEGLTGKQAEEIGLKPEEIVKFQGGFSETVNGKESFCVFTDAGSVLLGIARSNASLYEDVNRSTWMVALYLAVIALIMFASISGYIDRYIMDGIFAVNEKLVTITNGNLDTEVAVKSTPEFCELSDQINLMVKSLLDTTNKWSEILDVAKIPIGVYEYSEDMKRVMATKRVAEILQLPGEEAARIFSDSRLLEEKLNEVRKNPLGHESGVYEISGPEQRFIRIDVFSRNRSTLGMLTDVTAEILERRQIERERDIDLLTGLCSRRAFYSRSEELFENPGQLGTAVMIMADADHLKLVNDRYGHENGDRYLHRIAAILDSCGAEHKLAGRLSGDEFVLFLYGSPGEETLRGYVREMRERMNSAELEIDAETAVPVRFSFGCAFYPAEGTDCRSLLKLADERMYLAKKNKKEKSSDSAPPEGVQR